MPNLLSQLTAWRGVIGEPGKWTKGGMALNASGQEVVWDSPEACKWSIFGAGLKLWLEFSEAYSLVLETIRDLGFINFGHFNDAPTTTHADVMALFDKAIEIAKEREG
jgi:hypothetical protein